MGVKHGLTQSLFFFPLWQRTLSFTVTLTCIQLLKFQFVLKRFLLNLWNILALVPVVNVVIWLFFCSVNLCENPAAVFSFLVMTLATVLVDSLLLVVVKGDCVILCG